MSPPRLVAAPDRFTPFASAPEAALAMARAAREQGWQFQQVPLSDGSVGFSEVFAGRASSTTVTGPLGSGVTGEWRLLGDSTTAVIEAAAVCGLEVVGGVGGNDPVAADTTAVGQLIAAAVKAGARRVLIGAGGVAATDGGWGALKALEPHSRIHGVELVVACDTERTFAEAATYFAHDKGASPKQVDLLRRRLERLVQVYAETAELDVSSLPGSAAGGGLAGGLASIGARLVSGFDVVADVVALDQALEGADLVVTGEGLVDESSFEARPLGRVQCLAQRLGVPSAALGGEWIGDDPAPEMSIGFLLERFGRERLEADGPGCITEAVAGYLRSL